MAELSNMPRIFAEVRHATAIFVEVRTVRLWHIHLKAAQISF